MLKVLSVCTGDKYSHDYVHRLRSMVARHLTLDHTFHCITEHTISGIDCIPRRDGWPGWWSKLELFRPGMTGPFFYLDLDMLVIRSLDWIADYLDKSFCAVENWGSRTREGPLYTDELSSAMMIWNGDGSTDRIYQNFSEADIWRLDPHGDQAYVTEQMRDAVTLIPQEKMCSFKRHCLNGPPPEASVVAFHGRPRPHEVSDQWVKDAWQ